jgi:hypothetical protein
MSEPLAIPKINAPMPNANAIGISANSKKTMSPREMRNIKMAVTPDWN